MLRAFLLYLACLAAAIAQTSTPDCQFSATFTATGIGNQPANGFQNISTSSAPACVAWRLVYTSDGFTAVSIQVEGAKDVAGMPVGYAAAPSTVVTEGTNPLIDPDCNPAGSGCTNVVRAYYPWVRLNVTALTGSGTIKAKMYGYRGTAAAFSSSTSNSGNMLSPCTQASLVKQIYLPLSTSGSQTLVAGVAATEIRICHLWFSTGSPEDFGITDGTAADCSTGTTHTLANFYTISAVALDTEAGWATQTAGNNLCVNPSASQTAAVTVVYVQN